MDRSPTSATYLISAHECAGYVSPWVLHGSEDTSAAREHVFTVKTQEHGSRGQASFFRKALGAPAFQERHTVHWAARVQIILEELLWVFRNFRCLQKKHPRRHLSRYKGALFLETNYPSGLFLCSEGLPGLLAGTTTTRLLRALRRRQAPPQKTRSRACAHGPRFGSPKPRSPLKAASARCRGPEAEAAPWGPGPSSSKTPFLGAVDSLYSQCSGKLALWGSCLRNMYKTMGSKRWLCGQKQKPQSKSRIC